MVFLNAIRLKVSQKLVQSVDGNEKKKLAKP